MPAADTLPYGTWPSPITAERVAAGVLRLGAPAVDGPRLYWLEGRPDEGGRSVLVQRDPDGRHTDLTPAPYNVRTRVHEDGGGDYLVAGGTVWFANFDDQRVYRQAAGGAPEPLTAEAPWRFADFALDGARGRLVCVHEDHSGPGEPANVLAAIELSTGAVQVLEASHDFYASPRLAPGGRQLAWLTWDHPRMPWDGTELWVAALDADGRPQAPRRIAGGPAESVFQPEWGPDGALYFVSDPGGWWNIRRWDGREIQPLCPMEAEFGQPQWMLGMRTYDFDAGGRIVCAYCTQGAWHLARVDPRSGVLEALETPFTQFQGLRVAGHRAIFLGGAPDRPGAVVALDLAQSELQVLRESTALDFDPACIAAPEAVAFPTGGGDTAYGFFYAPRNPACSGPGSERPPLVVTTHGGPTGATSDSLNLSVQFWTSRGFAVLDVNYRGSTGYGRRYREALYGRWGVADVEDCIHGARHLVEAGRVDGERLVIRGASAGGYTTLAALTFHDVFHAGASHYGVSDLEALAQDTHKFESRYLDQLVGPYPQARATYRARSPLRHAERLARPVIFFQGLDDPVVPPNQAEAMVRALRERGLPVAYIAFEGEQHGFRRADSTRRALEAELYFYGRVLGFEPADTVEPVPIDNLAGE